MANPTAMFGDTHLGDMCGPNYQRTEQKVWDRLEDLAYAAADKGITDFAVGGDYSGEFNRKRISWILDAAGIKHVKFVAGNHDLENRNDICGKIPLEDVIDLGGKPAVIRHEPFEIYTDSVAQELAARFPQDKTIYTFTFHRHADPLMVERRNYNGTQFVQTVFPPFRKEAEKANPSIFEVRPDGGDPEIHQLYTDDWGTLKDKNLGAIASRSALRVETIPVKRAKL